MLNATVRRNIKSFECEKMSMNFQGCEWNVCTCVWMCRQVEVIGMFTNSRMYCMQIMGGAVDWPSLSQLPLTCSCGSPGYREGHHHGEQVWFHGDPQGTGYWLSWCSVLLLMCFQKSLMIFSCIEQLGQVLKWLRQCMSYQEYFSQFIS